MENVSIGQLNNFSEKHHEQAGDKHIFGFWLYLLTDLIMFAVLFACFAVLRQSTFGGPSGAELFKLPFVLIETLLLLTSSFTCGIAVLYAKQLNKKQVIIWLSVTFLLGASFLAMESYEMAELIGHGYGPGLNAFLSSFFTLVGTHGIHIASGLLWILIMVIMLWQKGFTKNIVNKLARFALFWHFLDLVWIFIFTIVYLYAHV